MAHRNLFASKNLDVAGSSHDSVTQAAKGSAGDLTPEPLLSVVYSDAARGEKQQRSYRLHGSKHLSLHQATNIVEAVDYARAIGLPLVAHATIHWSGTVVFDDPDGKLFAKVREGPPQMAPPAWSSWRSDLRVVPRVQSPHRHRALPFAFSPACRVSRGSEVSADRSRSIPTRRTTRQRHLGRVRSQASSSSRP
jgi:hypothetical protein